MIWINQHRDYDGHHCLYWPFGKTSAGYGQFGRGGKQKFVHRYMCEYAHGPSPSPKHQAAHSCGNGHLGCVNPAHLSWKTPRENQLDRPAHGTASTGYKRRKLTEEQAAQIRALTGLQPVAITAANYGVSEANIRHIQSGKTWAA